MRASRAGTTLMSDGPATWGPRPLCTVLVSVRATVRACARDAGVRKRLGRKTSQGSSEGLRCRRGSSSSTSQVRVFSPGPRDEQERTKTTTSRRRNPPNGPGARSSGVLLDGPQWRRALLQQVAVV